MISYFIYGVVFVLLLIVWDCGEAFVKGKKPYQKDNPGTLACNCIMVTLLWPLFIVYFCYSLLFWLVKTIFK